MAHGSFVTTRAAREALGVCSATLRQWADSGRIPSIRSPGGKHLYGVQSFCAQQGKLVAPATFEQTFVCYCRVSSAGQRDDLERQVAFMSKHFPGHRIIRDIGSGINFKRKGLLQVLELANGGALKEVVVAHRDRLCRFAFDLIEWLLAQRGVKLLVLDATHAESPSAELADDLMAIVQVFSCRVNGRRKYRANAIPPPKLVVRRLRIYPDTETATILKQWMGSTRMTYNMALSRIITHPKTPKRFFWLRNRFVNKYNTPASLKYLLDTPKHVREGALKDLALAYATNFAKLKIAKQ